MPCGSGSCNQPSIYRSPSAPNNNLRCASNACGMNKTNELGYILRDHAFSIVTAQQIVQQDAGESGCPFEVEVCLQLPCDIVSGGQQRYTTPLVLADGTPFYLRAGSILQKIVIAKNGGNDLDDDVQLILGTLGCDCATSNPTRFIECACPLTGCILNSVCSVRINDASLQQPLCQSVIDGCSGADLCATPCNPLGSSSSVTNKPGTCDVAASSCYSFTVGEQSDQMIGLTVLCGNLKTYQLRVFVQFLSVKCSSAVDICNACF